MQISSKTFDRAPSIRQLFPPKNLEEGNGCDTCSVQFINHQCDTPESRIHQCYSSKPLMLEDGTPSPRNSISSIPSNSIEHAVSIYQQVDRSSTSAISPLQVNDQMVIQHINSSEPPSSSFPAFSKFNLLIVHYLKFCYTMIHYLSILGSRCFFSGIVWHSLPGVVWN